MAIPGGQSGTAALLRRLAGRDPIETHISALFVGAREVWKLRKAVRLPFVDLSHPDERRRCALREVALNAPHAPGLYRGVLPVVRDGRGVVLDGKGEAIDWVVRMARVPDADFLPAIAASGGLDGTLLDAMADAVVAWHAPLLAADKPSGEAMRHIVLGNANAALAAGLDPVRVRRWLEWLLGELAATAGWHAGRTRAGFVRRGHGDLQLGNWCLWHGAPVPFDALDFDEELATTDVGYDLAFLLMDLDHRVGRAAANRVLNRSVARTGDVDQLRGLPLYLSTRAMIRAHIAAASFQPGEAEAYLAAALGCQQPAAARVVAVGGLPGAGKSTLARALAPDLGRAPGALVLRSDELRKRRFGVPPEQRLPADAYAEPVSRQVLAELCAAVAQARQAGQAVVADATFLDPADRAAVEAAAAPAPFTGLWLSAPLDDLARRVNARIGDASDADEAVLRRAAAGHAPAAEWHAVAADTPASALAAARRALC